MDQCDQVHEIFSSFKRHTFPFEESLIPTNGIYFLYEKGEYSHGTDRIVRVGTHTGKNQLCSRLKQHFLKENKDRSIFRKNIGRAILNKNNDPFLKFWEYDLTSKKNREKYLPIVDLSKHKKVEKEVTDYIQSNFSFVVFQIDDKDLRLELESKIISTVSLCNNCKASDNWLGMHSPKRKIRESGLWLVNQLYKEPLSVEDICLIRDN
jgi:hypothetical protein